MWHKVIIGLLSTTLIGAVGVGVYDASQTPASGDAVNVLAEDALASVSVEQPAMPSEQAQMALTATPSALVAPQAGTGTGPIEQQQALDMVGVPWSGIGTVVAIETNGVTLARKDGVEIFVEFGPSPFWADAPLAVGDTITVYGFYNGEQYHAGTVILADGSTLALRSETGLPLWSGGNGTGQTQTGAVNRNGQTEPQVSADAWVTLQGTVISADLSTLAVQTVTGEQLVLQLGQQAFVQQQGVTFAPGDEVSVLGYWQGTTFRAGEITKLATGERLMLLDPNGRPLWGGPGRAGQGGGNSAQGAQGQSQSRATQGGQGGRQYRGGRQ